MRPVFLPPAPLDVRVAFVSSYPPRKCGIATFTKDLATAVNNLNPYRLAEIIAMADPMSEGLDYPWEVSHVVAQGEWSDYQKVIDYLNQSVIDVVCLQHEFGIFGGDRGDMVVPFVEHITKPIVTTLHTVSHQPNAKQKEIIRAVCRNSAAVVVMLPLAKDLLSSVYGVATDNVVIIDHGAPDLPFDDAGAAKTRLGLKGKVVMSSINLISKWKSLEHAIAALPAVVAKHPDFVYLIIGQTHPSVLAREGEAYRHRLKSLVRRLGLNDHVRFVNRYISLDDLIEYISASDFYVTPYEGLEQISSGALAYAIAAGKVCISTPYIYAAEKLSGGRGFLVPPADPPAIAKAINQALKSPRDTQKMRLKCYASARHMTWSRVGFRYLRLFDHLTQAGPAKTVTAPSLSYVKWLTDDRGMVEHTTGETKNHAEGYSVDDNARGLIVSLLYGDTKLAKIYLKFLEDATTSDGRMHCDVGVDGTWHVKRRAGPYAAPGYADWFGRAVWGLALAVRHGESEWVRRHAAGLLKRLLPNAHRATTIRARAYVLLGLTELKYAEWEELGELRTALLEAMASSLAVDFRAHNRGPWHWFEDKLIYDNARLPESLIRAGLAFDRRDLLDVGLEALAFLIDETYDLNQKHFRFVGNKGWYAKGGTKAPYDEQPLEAAGMAQACCAAYEATGVRYWREMAHKALMWFWGENIRRFPMYNAARQSVYDGINHDGINHNQGAENVTEYLLAYHRYATIEKM